MPTKPSSIFDDTYSKGVMLLAILLFSWMLGIKNIVMEWVSSSDEVSASPSPNILMIVVDDLGYDDTTAINPNGLSTPNIKQLAEGGVTFRRHYADSTCTPSRVAMLTGRYPERSGFRPVGIEIPEEFATIAEQLNSRGYTSYLTGKWHAGEERPESRPENKGFSQWFGFLNQWELSGEVTDANKGGGKKPTYINPMLRTNGGDLKQYSGHLTDILTEHTIEKLEKLQAQENPWFVYHAFLAPHHPIQPADRYREKFPATPEGEYAALVTQLDEAIGRILAVVDRQNTLVIFVSDNGGTNEQRNNNYPFFGKKGEYFEGAYRTPLILNWPGVIPEGNFIDDIVMNVDIYPTILAAAHATLPEGIDGENLWPIVLNDTPQLSRSRSWEVFSANVNTFSYSLLSQSGEWRLSSIQGLPPSLFHLSEDPTGEFSVAERHPQIIEGLTTLFWQEYWAKSLLPISGQLDEARAQSSYQGFDTMRTPYRYGFAIGIELGPLPDNPGEPVQPLAKQEGFWELRLRADHEVEWQIGNAVLRDTNFDPARCNAIILTGYFEPLAHLAKREPESQLKLYSSGFLRDSKRAFDYETIAGTELNTPTVINFGGRAIFSNMMLSSFADTYSPRIRPEFQDIYTSLYREKKLSLADVQMMNSQLCK